MTHDNGFADGVAYIGYSGATSASTRCKDIGGGTGGGKAGGGVPGVGCKSGYCGSKNGGGNTGARCYTSDDCQDTCTSAGKLLIYCTSP